MEINANEVEINGVVYVRKSDTETSNVGNTSGLVYTIVRTYSAGVHAGYLKSRQGKECVLLKARRLYYWEGAASLSQLATEGTSKPEKCKFPCEVGEIILTEGIEFIPVTVKARESITRVEIWAA